MHVVEYLQSDYGPPDIPDAAVGRSAVLVLVVRVELLLLLAVVVAVYSYSYSCY